MIEQVETLLFGGGTAESSTPAADYKLFNDTSGRRVVVAGLIDRVDRIMSLLVKLDTGMDFQTCVYRIQNVPVQRIDRLIWGLVSQEESEASIETTVDEDGNLLIVRAPAEVHLKLKHC